MIGFYSDNGEFIFENDGVSWLLWIHLLVMFLLIVVLYYFTVFVSDGAATSEVGQISAKKYGQLEEFRKCKNNYLSNNISRSSCSQDIKIYKDKIINKGNASTSKRGIREREENQEIEEVKEYSTTTTTYYNQCYSYNPCYLLELGKRAFLKCLGLDSTTTTQDSSTVQQPSSLSTGNNVQGKLSETDKNQ